jgi:hypothetical protein
MYGYTYEEVGGMIAGIDDDLRALDAYGRKDPQGIKPCHLTLDCDSTLAIGEGIVVIHHVGIGWMCHFG